MARKPQWLLEGRSPPRQFRELLDRYGEEIRTGQVTQRELHERGVSAYACEALWALVRRGDSVADKKAAAARAEILREAEEITYDDDTIEALIERRCKAYARKAKKRAKRLHRISRAGPFAICHFGDPHVDSDGCDWPELLRTVRVVRETAGMYAGNVGDVANNWVGRLAALYKDQSSTEHEAFQLAEWLLSAVEWDYLVLGNHDHWNQGGMLYRYIAGNASIRVLEDHEARIIYDHPANPAHLVVRHDFRGASMWNKAHGGMRRAKMRPWGHIYVSGHRHTWASHVEEGADDGIPRTTLVVRGFKRFDTYAAKLDFPEDTLGASLTTVHDPDHVHPGERVRVYHCVEAAADYLGWLRQGRE